ncbi:hypothetical protein LOK49_LG06G00359 [Camellia lanceoleosa]|uniref:Uncharacterized protein n=1 Tax=Camellia lanceoleosa TaxID=1840588 RepID=A0ACC0HBB8_9ERIC|nr:hypothetical protein LOK49_LG06G00359 [Camellia lanceoleosa]
MVQQTIDSKFSGYGIPNTETGLANQDKQAPFAGVAKKMAREICENENRIAVPKSLGSTLFPKESGPTIKVIKAYGTKRPLLSVRKGVGGLKLLISSKFICSLWPSLPLGLSKECTSSKHLNGELPLEEASNVAKARGVDNCSDAPGEKLLQRKSSCEKLQCGWEKSQAGTRLREGTGCEVALEMTCDMQFPMLEGFKS